MSIIKYIAKILSLVIVLGLFFSGIFFVILPNKSIFENISTDFTESILGLEPKSGWKSDIISNTNVKSGYYIKPYVLGVEYPRVWVTSKDSIHKDLISNWKIYDASF
ncbi:MAG: hypothetical protein CMF96_06250 [Candidatus Marinimicrobia bacterium]|nr:hypothetical protein [Candidatus Neomarinimicrobiota bacterium]|tara:strand:- start:634 stop:954 length:321 start_codon:yes stop_codon:yes gene_type:complete